MFITPVGLRMRSKVLNKSGLTGWVMSLVRLLESEKGILELIINPGLRTFELPFYFSKILSDTLVLSGATIFKTYIPGV